MKFSVSISFAVAAVVALMSSGSVEAADHRVLAKYPADITSGEVFCEKWNSHCKKYIPAERSLRYFNSYCHPGDFQGNNEDKIAKVYCAFANAKTTRYPDRHVAREIGATIV